MLKSCSSNLPTSNREHLYSVDSISLSFPFIQLLKLLYKSTEKDQEEEATMSCIPWQTGVEIGLLVAAVAVLSNLSFIKLKKRH